MTVKCLAQGNNGTVVLMFAIVADLIIGTSLLLEFCLTQKYHTKRNLKTYIKNVCFHRMIKGVRHFKATE